jgi:hypothetical protein
MLWNASHTIAMPFRFRTTTRARFRYRIGSGRWLALAPQAP